MSTNGRALAWALVLCCAWGAWFWQQQFRREFYFFKGFRAMRANAVPAAVEFLKPRLAEADMA